MTLERDMSEWCNAFKASRQWLTAVQADRSGSVHTQKSYCQALKVFCDWIGKNPDELIAEKRVQLKNPETEMDMENNVRQFVVWLEKKRKLSRTTVATRYHAPIRSFFKYNNLPLRLKSIKYVAQERQPHTMEEVKVLLQVADVREKAIIMLLKDSGISREDALKLKYSNIHADYEANKETVHIRLVRTKESVRYDTFLGPNALEALRVYLEYRKRHGEQITKESYLIAQLNGQPTTPENLSQMFTRLGKKVGFHTSPHRFRKFFATRLGLAVPSLLVSHWLGHSLGVESSYFLPDIEKQRQQYLQGYKELDVSETKAMEEIEKLKETKKTTNGLIQMQQEKIQTLETKIDELKRSLTELPRRAKELRESIKRGEFEYETKKDCQKIIDEKELETYVRQGWRFVSTLPSGKIVVSNE